MGPGPGDRQAATAELAAVLTELGVDCAVRGAGEARDGHLVVAGSVRVEVEVATRPTIGRLARLGVARAGDGAVRVLVADQLDPGVRRALKDAGWGWLARTGHLRLMAGAVQIDRAVPGLLGPDPSPVDPLGRPTGMAVALELLHAEQVPSVRALARAAGVSVAAAHATIAELRTVGLVAERQVRHPELFWAVADRWHLRWFALARPPSTDVPAPIKTLVRMECDDVVLPGWAQVGDRVAQALGVRIAGEDGPRFYLPDRRALSWTLRTFGEAVDAQAASGFVAVPPTSHATAQRSPGEDGWPAARPVVVALALASDGSPRSRELLAGWDRLPEGLARVW